mmetsp:Transcript_28487/g.32576  ORF Transcript_28487/g.32576 Transcript_28487/m.32576 type:complete len:92 (+) Transcript_28487:338-613(+)
MRSILQKQNINSQIASSSQIANSETHIVITHCVRMNECSPNTTNSSKNICDSQPTKVLFQSKMKERVTGLSTKELLNDIFILNRSRKSTNR